MATSTDAIIFRALVEHLKTLPVLLPIAGQNVGFPQAGQQKPAKHLSITFMPNRTRQITMGPDPQQKIGILQVSVMWPKGQGIEDALMVSDNIINHFKNQVLIASGVRITINSEPWAAPPLQDVDRLNVPVSIPYIAFEQET